MQIEGLTKRYGRVSALDRVSFSAERKVYGLMGPNGAGKTTLLRCIAGLCKADSGRIAFEREEMIGYLPQSFGAISSFTVFEMMEFYSVYRHVDPNANKLIEYLAMVNLVEAQNTRVSNLSGGMLRRLGIAQALIGDPTTILFDEPTVGLDPEERVSFLKLIDRIKDGRTIILSTHILSDVDRVCDYRVFMSNGKICAIGTEEELCQRVMEESGNLCTSTEEAYLWLVRQV